EVALGAVDRPAFEVFERVGDVPAVAGAAAGPLDVPRAAAALGGGAAGQAQFVPFQVLAQHDVDHAGHRVGAVNGRCAAGQYLDAFDHRRGNGRGIREVALAVVGLRVFR